ncbi:serine hydrolase [Thomasclavelia cocleata]|uniref:serine hydrolase domain-containing protein n=1 Tax=Thomasclavelia cocleata TaxID=69824 RepID=UPI0035189BAB
MNKEEFHNIVIEQQPNICQIVCYKDNQNIYSDVWNNYKENDAVHIMSVTKSIVSLLIGICIDKGLIKSIDDKILDYFPNYKVKRGEKTIFNITIKHLMTMKTPLKCKYDPWVKVCSSDDWTIASLDFIGGRKGITNEFKYNTVCLHVLTGIIAKVSNMTPVEFANIYLFEPLGIVKHKHYLAETAEEHKAFTMSKAPKEHIWFEDPQGVGTAGYGLCMSASDLAKIGFVMFE